MGLLRALTTSTQDLLTTTAAYRDAMGATATEDDDLQADALRHAQEWAETFLGYSLALTQWGERLPGYGGARLMLSQTPIVQVDRVFHGGSDTGVAQHLTTGFQVESARAGLLYRVDGLDVPWSAQAVGLLRSPDPVAGTETLDWWVEYWGGYVGRSGTTSTALSTSTGQTLPRTIERALWEAARQTLDGDYGDVASKSIGGLSISYAQSGDGLKPAERLLAPYRRAR